MEINKLCLWVLSLAASFTDSHEPASCGNGLARHIMSTGVPKTMILGLAGRALRQRILTILAERVDVSVLLFFTASEKLRCASCLRQWLPISKQLPNNITVAISSDRLRSSMRAQASWKRIPSKQNPKPHNSCLFDSEARRHGTAKGTPNVIDPPVCEVSATCGFVMRGLRDVSARTLAPLTFAALPQLSLSKLTF